MAIIRLSSELKQLNKDPNYLYSANPNEDNFLLWNFVMIGPPETYYEGGIFNGTIEFPKEYPIRPPKLKFSSNMYHPNIYKDGNVCISILHEGVDEYNYENPGERWNPSHGINSILMSVLSMLGYPNFDSPANIDASVEWRNDNESYRKKIYKIVSETQNIG